jgi:hypothetical protein
LGVTEAGEGEDGRMKSAIGIGTLLQVCMWIDYGPVWINNLIKRAYV